MKNKALLTVFVATSLLPLYGGIVTYSDSPTYLAAGTNFGTVTFAGSVSGVSQFFVQPGFPQGASTYYFTQNDSGRFTEYGNLGGEFGSTPVLLYNGSSFLMGIPSGVNGIGFNIGCYSCTQTTPIAMIKVYGIDQTTLLGSYTNVPVNAGTTTFWGVRSDTAIGEIAISYGQTYPGLISLNVGGAATSGGGGGGPTDTPEAATLILIGSGLAVMAKWRRFGRTDHPSL